MDTRILRALRKNPKGQTPKRRLAPNQCPLRYPSTKEQGRSDPTLKSKKAFQASNYWYGLGGAKEVETSFEKVFTGCCYLFETGDWSIGFEFYGWKPKPRCHRNLGDFWTLSCKSSPSEYMRVWPQTETLVPALLAQSGEESRLLRNAFKNEFGWITVYLVPICVWHWRHRKMSSIGHPLQRTKTSVHLQANCGGNSEKGEITFWGDN